MTDKLIDRIKAHNSAPTIYDAPDPVEMAKRILADAEALKAADGLLHALSACLNFISNTESEMGETLMCGDTAREALAAYDAKRGER
jgi:hypothetical protein